MLDQLLSPAVQDEALPESVGGFRVLGLLGEGGMGTVFRAEQPSPKREVALKLLRIEAMATPGATRRFVREIETLGRLQHPNIATVLSTGIDRSDGVARPYFTMELVRGGLSLTEHAVSQGLGLRSRVELIRQTCAAIAHGHARGVIHRDIKPSNVLVTEGGSVRVIDFGVARLLEDGPEATTLTKAGSVVGTLPYMSPEQFEDRADTDSRSDVYSLGVLAYETLTGSVPFDVSGVTLSKAAARVRLSPIPEPVFADRPLPLPLRCIVTKALAKNPNDRYATAAEFEHDLSNWLQGKPVSAKPEGRHERIVRWFAEHPKTSMLIASLVISACIVTGSAAALLWVRDTPAGVTNHPDGKGYSVLSLSGRELQHERAPAGSHLCANRVSHGDGTWSVLAFSGENNELRVDALHPSTLKALWSVDSNIERYPGMPELEREDLRPIALRLGRPIVSDYFPDSPGDEVLVTAGGHPTFPSCVRIYSSKGDILMEFWHPGHIDATVLHLRESNRLVCLGAFNRPNPSALTVDPAVEQTVARIVLVVDLEPSIERHIWVLESERLLAGYAAVPSPSDFRLVGAFFSGPISGSPTARFTVNHALTPNGGAELIGLYAEFDGSGRPTGSSIVDDRLRAALTGGFLGGMTAEQLMERVRYIDYLAATEGVPRVYRSGSSGSEASGPRASGPGDSAP
jgi:serine/threonine protein kinase